ncbi:hypothetical protein MT418_006025 [Batrachochytrium dendrobatidis]
MLSAMSSTKHRPNPRKRPIDLVTPEFPPLPAISSLKATVEFAAKSQEALRSIPTISTNLASLFLPLISPNRLQRRFRVEENTVFVVMTKSYPLLKNELDLFSVKDFYGIYVRGPVGVGKSYLLYLLAAEYRLNRENYRVTYINNCAAWRAYKFGYILRELVTTFYDDTIGEKSIVEWCQAVTESNKEEEMMMMMESLVNYIHLNKLQWIVIFDQHNALFDPSVIKDFPFSLINYLSNHQNSNIKIIVSASASNEGYPTKMKDWHTHDLSSHRFDQEEFKVWCDHYLLEDNTKVDHESEEAMDALFWTGGVPYELDLLWKQPEKCLIEKTILYRRERFRDMAFSHGKFCDKLSDEKKNNLKECISRMALRLSPPEINIGMDRQLFNIIEDEDGHKIITALNPVARRALLYYHGRGLMTCLGFLAEIVLKGTDYPNSIKGKISEMYITTMLELSQLFTFEFRKVANIAKIGSPEDSTERKSIEIKSVVRFLTNKLPPKTSFHKNITSLFVPESPNYPRFDFFLWDSKRQIMMGFQVTVHNPFSDHPKMTNSQTWQRFCFGNSKQTPMELYWVVPKRCIGTDTASVVDDSIILFEDLISDFPALGKLNH